MSAAFQHLLIIDHLHQDQSIIEYFTQFGFGLDCFPDLQSLDEYKEDVIAILINSHTLKPTATQLQALFKQFHTPIIIISDTLEKGINIDMLEQGADDFLVRPIQPRELHARITAINRRIRRSDHIQDQEKESLFFNKWHLLPASRQLFNDKNEELSLSMTEYNLLLIFLRQPQQIIERSLLFELTNNSKFSPLDRRIDIQISRLRQKIEPDPTKPKLIKTIRNKGYIFTAEVISNSKTQ